jgi:hypothetical protein
MCCGIGPATVSSTRIALPFWCSTWLQVCCTDFVLYCVVLQQMQTRSADEPMTTFVSCVACGNKWKCEYQQPMAVKLAHVW